MDIRAILGSFVACTQSYSCQWSFESFDIIIGYDEMGLWVIFPSMILRSDSPATFCIISSVTRVLQLILFFRVNSRRKRNRRFEQSTFFALDRRILGLWYRGKQKVLIGRCLWIVSPSLKLPSYSEHPYNPCCFVWITDRGIYQFRYQFEIFMFQEPSKASAFFDFVGKSCPNQLRFGGRFALSESCIQWLREVARLNDGFE